MTKPKYRVVADDLRERLRAVEFPIGTYLPSIAALQDTYDIPGLNTVRQGLSVLAEEGWVESYQGRGTVVLRLPPTLDDRADKLRRLRSTVDELTEMAASHQILVQRARELLGALDVGE